MSWIKTISFQEAKGKLLQLYKRVSGPDQYLDNILMVHSLRPQSLKGHMVLYKNVLHHRDNTLPKWLLETLGVYVSLLNECTYCVEHHFSGLQRLLNDQKKAAQFRQAMEADDLESVFSGRELALLNYAKKLTLQAGQMQEEDLNDLRSDGLTDGEILEANQVISYFSYANRTVLGLGVTTEGDILGLSPNDNDSEENWSHQ